MLQLGQRTHVNWRVTTRRRGLSKTCRVCLVLLPLWGAASTGALADPIVFDDFNDNRVNTSLWTLGVTGTGPTIAEINQRVEITFPPNSVDDPAAHIFAASFGSRCLFGGDFDVQVDYELLIWPFASGVRVGLLSDPGAMERTSFGTSADFGGQPREVYLRDLGGSVTGITATGDLAGKLRLSRSGNVLTPYYFSAGIWIALPSTVTTTDPMHVGIASWSHDYAFTDQGVAVAFDNFTVNQGQLACPDADGDGSPANLDCNDSDASIYPGAPELCDGKDNNCDGIIPANEADADGDGFRVCQNDCNDSNPNINPTAIELPGNTVDENCDGSLGACDPTASWRSHGQFVRCVAREVDDLVTKGLITEEQGDALVRSAGQSSVGK